MGETFFTVAVILGIAGLIILSLALMTGLKVIKVKTSFKFHKRWAIIGFIGICIHAVVMLYFYFSS
jgi:DMSO/TMAO reductase YedYZ heme-binding membrane subunit